MNALSWSKLLSTDKRKDIESGDREPSDTKGNRTETERDYDRILFCAPTRRLSDKTQVFPLESNDSVRTRLTHSHEVSNLARGFGKSLCYEYKDLVFGEAGESLQVERKVPDMLAAIGLVHDMGNPPFGHQGEKAVQAWFNKQIENPEEEGLKDFTNFDGNPQTFRLITKLQLLNDDFGLNLTCGTLAASIKYPCTSENHSTLGYKKVGVFKSEEKAAGTVWENTGLEAGVRHPLTHVMEACDDIAYGVIDSEDTVKKGFASYYDLIDFLHNFGPDEEDSFIQEHIVKFNHGKKNQRIKAVLKYAKKWNEIFTSQNLSSKELNSKSIDMFRVGAIHQLIDSATNSFVSQIKNIMDNRIDSSFELLKVSDAFLLSKALKEFSKKYGFAHREVHELELKGHNHITSTMDMLWEAIDSPETPFARYARSHISENYRRIEETSVMPNRYKKFQLLADTISGMTDSHLINLHDHLKPLYMHYHGKS